MKSGVTCWAKCALTVFCLGCTMLLMVQSVYAAKATTGKKAKVAAVLAAKTSPIGIMPPRGGIASLGAQAYAAWEKSDYVVAGRLWEALAANGSSEAMTALATLWEEGLGVTADSQKAVFWLQKAARLNDPVGMNNYAYALEQGKGISQNLKEALGWYEKAAQTGLAPAMYNLGVMYERGTGVQKNMTKAFQYYSQTAKQHFLPAQVRLGQMYRDGDGVKKDLAKATLLFYGAAMAGDKDSTERLWILASSEEDLPAVDVFGVPLASAKRDLMRRTLANAKVKVVSEENAQACDVYDVKKSIPGALEMAVCYGVDAQKSLGFVKLSYAAPDGQIAADIQEMLVERYGNPSAVEGKDMSLWNLGNVLVSTQYLPAEKIVGLMYMVPNTYHLTVDSGKKRK